MDAVTFRGLERLIIVIGAIVFAYLGYRLFLAGIDKGPGKLEAQTRFYKFVFSGVGPGLFFMAFGAVVLVTALFTGGATSLQSDSNSINDTGAVKSQPRVDRTLE